MKIAIKLTLAVVLVMSATSLFAQKFGRINSEEILAVMPEMKDMRTNMEAFAKDLDDTMENMTVEFNTRVQDFQKNYATYSEAIREVKAKEIDDMKNRREQFQQAAQQDYQKRTNELMAPIIEKVRGAINKIGASGMYLGIFDIANGGGGLIYFDEANMTDIAPLVKKELGITAAPAAPAAAAPAAAPAAKK